MEEIVDSEHAYRKFHRCSVGLRSGDLDGQSITSIQISRTDPGSVWTGIIVHENDDDDIRV